MAEPPLTVKMINYVHRIWTRKGAYHLAVCYPHASSLPSLWLWSLCQKCELLIKPAVKVNEQYCWDILLSQQMLDAINA